MRGRETGESERKRKGGEKDEREDGKRERGEREREVC